ncbi:unnamed protein product, partial [Cuscuta campestris]
RPPPNTLGRDKFRIFTNDRIHHRQGLDLRSRRRWPFRSTDSKGLEESYVLSSTRLARQDEKEPALASQPTRNSTFTFRTQNKVFQLFHSHYNKTFCITECGYKRYHLWFDLDTIRWVIESIPRVSGFRSWALFLFGDNRTIELSAGSNRRGEFIRIQEKRREGKRYILIPSGPKNADVGLFIKALSFFYDKVTKTVQSQALDTVPVLTTVPQAPIQPQNLALATNTQHLEGRVAHIGENEDDMMVEEDNCLIVATTSPMSEYRPAAFHGGPVPTPSHAIFPTLSPFAPPFVPVLTNNFATLFSHNAVENKRCDDQDPSSKTHDKNRVLLLNAVEDIIEDRDGPILYTHSDGEDIVFIDTKLKPL